MFPNVILLGWIQLGRYFGAKMAVLEKEEAVIFLTQSSSGTLKRSRFGKELYSHLLMCEYAGA